MAASWTCCESPKLQLECAGDAWLVGLLRCLGCFGSIFYVFGFFFFFFFSFGQTRVFTKGTFALGQELVGTAKYKNVFSHAENIVPCVYHLIGPAHVMMYRGCTLAVSTVAESSSRSAGSVQII